MSTFTGPQGKGAAKSRRAKMRAEAEQRNAATPWDRRAKSRRPCPHLTSKPRTTVRQVREP